MSSRKQLSSKGWIGPLVIAAGSFAVVLGLVLGGRYILDSVNYYSYQPNDMIASFVSNSGMSATGKFLFYASQPTLESAQTFNKECGRAEATTAILGCYNGQKIYIYDIRDERLAGIREATAAHEMLHAAYDRLSAGEKKRIGRLLDAEFEKRKSDKKLADQIAFYDRYEPGERNNELHSILGTEASGLSPELETYYGRYFTDRAKVVALHDRYEGVFTSLQARADDLNGQIKSLSASIKNDTAAYNKELGNVQAAISNFNDRAQRGDFRSQEDFASQRRSLVARVAALESLRDTINSTIQEYNKLVTELEGIATQTDDLNRSIDSNLAPPPSL